MKPRPNLATSQENRRLHFAKSMMHHSLKQNRRSATQFWIVSNCVNGSATDSPSSKIKKFKHHNHMNNQALNIELNRRFTHALSCYNSSQLTFYKEEADEIASEMLRQGISAEILNYLYNLYYNRM